MSLEDDLKRLISEYQRRLQRLKEQKARLGINTPPEILTEIEDIEVEIERLQTELKSLEASGDPENPQRATENLKENPMLPKVEFSPKISLAADKQEIFEDILQRMFPAYQRIVIEEEFGEGSFSGSWVFLVHLIRQPMYRTVVVKIASRSLIEKEWQAYKEYVLDTWRYIAKIEDQPVVIQDGAFGGLYYDVVGEGIFPVKSLRRYCLEATAKDIQALLAEQLTKILEHVLALSQPSLKVRLRASYDPILPVNLLITPLSSPLKGEPLLITPKKLPLALPEPDTHVRLEGFVVTKVDLKDCTITLNLPHPEHDLPDDSFMVRLKYETEATIPACTIGQPLSTAIVGQVLKTRTSQWQEEMQKVMLGENFDLNSPTAQMSNGEKLPNPLVKIPDILNQFRNLKIYYTHGDLNLENALVVQRGQDVRLIDFAEARKGHVLHDLLRLETEVLTKLIPPALVEAGLSAEIIHPFYEQLHCATFHSSPLNSARSPEPALEKAFTILSLIRGLARKYALFKQDDFEEYYQCLTLYLLGALKFGNLDKAPNPPLPKQVAFWGAATVQALLKSDPCLEIVTPDGKSIAQPNHPDTIARPHSSEVVNPFITGERVSDLMQQLKLSAIVNDCRGLLTRRVLHNIAIEGEHGFGKTTLLKFIRQAAHQEKWGEPDLKLIFIELDCQTIDPFKPDHFWRRILEKLRDEVRDEIILKEKIDETLAKSKELDVADFTDLYASLKQSDYGLVLLLDEFDTIVKTDAADPGTIRSFLTGLRSSSQEYAGIALVTCTRVKLTQVCSNIVFLGSPFSNDFNSVSLTLFSSDDINELLKHAFEEIDPPLHHIGRNLLGNLAGGNPVLLLRAGELIFEQHRHSPLTKEGIKTVIRNFEKKADRYFSLYWKKSSPPEQSLFIGLILAYLTKQSFPSLSNKDAEFIDHLLQIHEYDLGPLEDRGLITAEGETYRLFSLAFATWIVRKVAAEDESQFAERYQALESEWLKQTWPIFKKLTRPPILKQVLQTLEKGISLQE